MKSQEEYFSVCSTEYQVEFSRKDGIENRAGIILALLALLPVTYLDLFSGTYSKAVYFLLGTLLTVYISALLSTLMVIVPMNFAYYDVSGIDVETLSKEEPQGLSDIISDYKQKIQTNRKQNEKKQRRYTFALRATILFIILYFVTMVIIKVWG